MNNINIVKQSRNELNLNKTATQSFQNDVLKGNTYYSERENSLQNKSKIVSNTEFVVRNHFK
jgi:hypothetical protein